MNKEDNVNSLAHTKWNCKYHIVFAPKYRRKVFYEDKRLEIREILRKLCEWKGVEIIEDTIRRYNNSEYFAAIIGYTGKISAEEYEELSADDDRYTLNDVIGKAGIEQVMDKQLQGSKGYEKLYVDYLGKTIELIEREEATAGNDVYLSIDADLTIAAYDLMEQEIAGIVYSNIENYKSDIPIPFSLQSINKSKNVE